MFPIVICLLVIIVSISAFIRQNATTSISETFDNASTIFNKASTIFNKASEEFNNAMENYKSVNSYDADIKFGTSGISLSLVSNANIADQHTRNAIRLVLEAKTALKSEVTVPLGVDVKSLVSTIISMYSNHFIIEDTKGAVNSCKTNVDKCEKAAMYSKVLAIACKNISIDMEILTFCEEYINKINSDPEQKFVELVESKEFKNKVKKIIENLNTIKSDINNIILNNINNFKKTSSKIDIIIRMFEILDNQFEPLGQRIRRGGGLQLERLGQPGQLERLDQLGQLDQLDQLSNIKNFITNNINLILKEVSNN